MPDKKNPPDTPLTEDDLSLWNLVTQSIKPFSGKVFNAIKPSKEQSSYSKKSLHPTPPPSASTPTTPPSSPLHQYLSVGNLQHMDKQSAKRFKKGKWPIEARLDLHGYDKIQASAALSDFIHSSYQQQKRCVIVITGKGKDSPGILKQQVPLWLNEPNLRSYILGFSYARPHDGGEGALYILLKRARSL